MTEAISVRGVLEAFPDDDFTLLDRTLHVGETTQYHRARCLLRVREPSGRVVDVDAREASLGGFDSSLEWSGPWSEIAHDPRVEPFLAQAPGPHVEVKLRVTRIAVGDEVIVRGPQELLPTDFRSASTRIVARRITAPSPREAKLKEQQRPIDPGAAKLRWSRLGARLVSVALLGGAGWAISVGLALPHLAAWVGAATFALVAMLVWVEGERPYEGMLLPMFVGTGTKAMEVRSDVTRACIAVFLSVPLLFVAVGLDGASTDGAYDRRGRTKAGAPSSTAAGTIFASSAVACALAAALAIVSTLSEQTSRRRLRVLLSPASASPRLGSFSVVAGVVGLEGDGPGLSATWTGGRNAALARWAEEVADGRYWVLSDDGSPIRVSEGAVFATTFVTRTKLGRSSHRLLFRCPSGASVRLAAHVTQGEERLEVNLRGRESILLLCHDDGELASFVRNARLVDGLWFVGAFASVLAAASLVLAIM